MRGKTLAAMTEIQESQISRYKNGVRAKIQVEDVDNICNALNISRVWLLYGARMEWPTPHPQKTEAALSDGLNLAAEANEGCREVINSDEPMRKTFDAAFVNDPYGLAAISGVPKLA